MRRRARIRWDACPPPRDRSARTAGPRSITAPPGARSSIGALGVVFGDIGTSPLYTVQTVFNPSDPHPVAVTHDSVFGIISLIFWSVTIVVTVTYVLLVMRADNDGEGGIMALITLIRRRGCRAAPDEAGAGRRSGSSAPRCSSATA